MKKSGKGSVRNKETNLFDDPLAGDLSEMMINADWKTARFELTQPKTETVTLRMSKDLLKGIKEEAKKLGLDYQKFMRIMMENHIRRNKAS
jgi:predicted DNA binding CopG/RHH family protein